MLDFKATFSWQRKYCALHEMKSVDPFSDIYCIVYRKWSIWCQLRKLALFIHLAMMDCWGERFISAMDGLISATWLIVFVNIFPRSTTGSCLIIFQFSRDFNSFYPPYILILKVVLLVILRLQNSPLAIKSSLPKTALDILSWKTIT